MKVPKTVDDMHDVSLDDGPTCLEESAREAVRTGCLINGHLVNSLLNLLLGERCVHAIEVNLLEMNLVPIKISTSLLPSTKDVGEVVMYNGLLSRMVGDPSLVVL